MARVDVARINLAMRITLIDDSIPFDGFTPSGQPLGGPEKAFASLPGALVRRGHQVTAINRCRYRLVVEGAQWLPWDEPRPAQTDVLIAFRKPALLDAVRQSGKRLLWVTAPPRYLDQPANRKILESFRPRLALVGRIQKTQWSNWLPAAPVMPGIRPEYLLDAPTVPCAPPRAVATIHPSHGLDWLIELWRSQIRPQVPQAELHVFSAILDKGAQGEEVPEAVRPVLARALAAKADGVVIRKPRNDGGMAEEYRMARVHLHPGHADDLGCFTLTESQAAGLPAVARPLGAAPERLRDGETGHIVPDEAAFANVARLLLTDDTMFWSMNQAARTGTRRSWDDAAADFESIWA
ncbi:MAG: glycosyltransferase family 4 protein [Alphaproteobacteria bacterium]|nr:glycosyltransferase family 4 protein [Alphaproteobacteria bacterium]